MAVMSNRLHHQRYVRGMRARSISVVKRETGKARSAVGLGEVEAVLSKLSFGTLLGSTVAAWGRAAFTDLRQEASGAAQERNGPEGGLLLDSRGGEMGGLQTLVSTPEAGLLSAANVSLVAALSYRWVESGHFPLSNLYESLMFLGWGMTSVQLWLQTKVSKAAAAGTLVTAPGALLIVAFAALLLPPELQKAGALVPALKSNWLTMHVTVVMMAYAALLVGSLLSAGYILLDQPEESTLGKLRGLVPSLKPQMQGVAAGGGGGGESTGSEGADNFTDGSSSIEVLRSNGTPSQGETELSRLLKNVDNLAYRSVGLGFAFLTVGIVSGAVWANEAWGSYWSWDPKETWALITWLVYAMYLHSRLSLEWEKGDVAKLGAAGFLVVMTCYIGVNLWGVGLHSYGFFSK